MDMHTAMGVTLACVLISIVATVLVIEMSMACEMTGLTIAIIVKRFIGKGEKQDERMDSSK